MQCFPFILGGFITEIPGLIWVIQRIVNTLLDQESLLATKELINKSSHENLAISGLIKAIPIEIIKMNAVRIGDINWRRRWLYLRLKSVRQSLWQSPDTNPDSTAFEVMIFLITFLPSRKNL